MGSQIKVIIPKKFNSNAFRKNFRKAVEEFANLPKADFEKTVRYWKGDRPKFVKAIIEKSDRVIVQIRVTGGKGKDKFNWLDKGTPAHIIRAKNKKTLAFNSGTYKAGSKPKTTAVGMSKPASGAKVFPVEVHHPGIAARGWRDVIIARNEPHFRGLLQRAMSASAKESGHGVK